MKGFYFALALLLAVAISVTVNAEFVKGTEAALSSAAEAFADGPTEDTVQQIRNLRQEFETARKKLSFSVNFFSLDRVGELLASLEAYARSGDVSGYASTYEMLRDALKDLSRLERVSWGTLF